MPPLWAKRRGPSAPPCWSTATPFPTSDSTPSAARPRVGVYLPQFRRDDSASVETARLAEQHGLDGVFVLDHLWAPANPRKATLPIFDLLHSVAVKTDRIAIGTLVTKIGIRPDEELLSHFTFLSGWHGARVIAGLGTGDANSLPEYESLGIEMPPMNERRRRLTRVARRLTEQGIDVWLGGNSEALKVMASATRTTLNLWQPDHERLLSAREGQPFTWGGVVPADVEEAVAMVRPAVVAGATWIVMAPKGITDSYEKVAFAMECRERLQSVARG